MADAESQVYDYAHSIGIDGSVVKEAMREYTSWAQRMTGPMSDEDLDDLVQRYVAKGVPEKVANEYKRWARENGLI